MNLFTPVILLSILSAITLVLILFDRLMGGGGEKIITINESIQLPVTSDESVLQTLAQNKIFLPSACGGKATCGVCKCRVIEGGGAIKPTEDPFLSVEERANGVRLSCQVKVKGDMKIEIPDELLTAQEFKTVIEDITDLTYDIKSVRFRLIEPKTIDFKPGQFAQIRVPGLEVMRAYSMASNPADNTIVEMIIRLVPNGTATTYVHKALEVGDKAILTGPFGNFYLNEASDADMVCIAGGSGMAPIRSILMYMRDRGMKRKVKYFFGAKSTDDLFYVDELNALSKEFPNFQFIPALSEPKPGEDWTGEVGLITDVVDRLTGDLSQSEAYLCGSPGMINACINVLRKHDVPETSVFYDKFS